MTRHSTAPPVSTPSRRSRSARAHRLSFYWGIIFSSIHCASLALRRDRRGTIVSGTLVRSRALPRSSSSLGVGLSRLLTYFITDALKTADWAVIQRSLYAFARLATSRLDRSAAASAGRELVRLRHRRHLVILQVVSCRVGRILDRRRPSNVTGPRFWSQGRDVASPRSVLGRGFRIRRPAMIGILCQCCAATAWISEEPGSVIYTVFSARFITGKNIE